MRRPGRAGLLAALALSTAGMLLVSGAALGISPTADKHAPTPTPQPTPPTGQLHSGTGNPGITDNVCNQADFGFAIDLSSSIGTGGNFAPEKNGAKAFADAFQGAGGDGLYAGTRFSGDTASTFTSGFVSAANFKTAVNGLPSPNGTTPTSAGIAKAAGNTAGNRASVPNVMFVITDGSPNRPPTNGSLSSAATWLTAANAAIDAANSARSAGWIVEAIYVGTPDASMPWGSSGNALWVQAVMTQIGGGSYTQLSSFTSLVNGLLVSVGCPTTPPSEMPTKEPTAPPTQEPTAPPTEEPTAPPTKEPTAPPTEEPTKEPTAPPTAPPTQEPTAPPTEEPTQEPTAPPTEEPTKEPTAPPTEEPTETPFESFQGETATPTTAPTATPTGTPFESFQGETATPVQSATLPPTNGGSTPTPDDHTPLLAVMICLAFGGLGLLAVESQRRSIRR
jgi:von Willebrand factor type A domain